MNVAYLKIVHGCPSYYDHQRSAANMSCERLATGMVRCAAAEVNRRSRSFSAVSLAVEMFINSWFGHGAGNNMIKKSWQQTTS